MVLKKMRWLHKYLGLIALPYLIWMSISGVLLNHPDLIQNISVPQKLLPPAYRLSTWNRGTMNQVIYSQKNPDKLFVSGKAGVWISMDGGEQFQDFNQGLPVSLYYRKTNSMLLIETDTSLLLAGTDRGLFARDLNHGNWQPVQLGKSHERIMKLLMLKDSTAVFTASNVYISKELRLPLQFRKIDLKCAEGLFSRVSIIKLFLALHDGSIWFLPGRLLFDVVGVLIVFLSISGFVFWYFPRRIRRKFKRITSIILHKNVFRFMYKYHLKTGLWSAAIIVVIAVTGFFLRPPMIILIAGGSIPKAAYPGIVSKNSWHEKIQNALYDEVNDRVLIQATDGFWSGSSSFEFPFKMVELDLPVFVMGATVFEQNSPGKITAGSFSGLFCYESEQEKTIDMLTGKEIRKKHQMRPAEQMITGYFTTPNGESFITAHKQGLIPLGKSRVTGRFNVPDELKHNYRMPLWNFLFELHNGRLFKDYIGRLFILITPLGALSLLLIVFTGLYIWIIRSKYRLNQ